MDFLLNASSTTLASPTLRHSV
ncbi:hypothetical protein Gogos_004765 [Gossypium gossypioides]|uniref:Uncharacterized protein n=1 Tax=Gossypium gossypioides TaxID=34282 RepID=A0A7J9CHD7_GOSGO|nr:hypothetical protein [Gossypium gossypioides]